MVNTFNRNDGTFAQVAYADMTATSGSGGTVTQLVNRSTAVSINKISGQITMFTTSPVVGNWVLFAVANNLVAATDTIITNMAVATNNYTAQVSAVTTGGWTMAVLPIGGTSVDAPVINFAVIKAVNS